MPLMRLHKYLFFLIAGIYYSFFAFAADKPAPVTDAASSNIEQRLDKLERLLQSQGLLDMLQQLEALQNEINQLRGQIEVQNHTLEQIKKRQREIYTDLDRRIQRIGTGDNVAMERSPDDNPPLEVLPTVDPATQTSTGETGSPLTIEKVEPPIEPTETTALTSQGTTAPPAVSADPATIKTEYQKAFKLLKQSQYDKAIDAFGKFLNNHPESQYSDNAQYWLGEAYYVTRRYEEAITEYNKLVSLSPESTKITHSLLKMGYSYQELGQMEEAKKTLTNLKEYYPGTTAARLAEDRLRRINASE